MSILEKIIKTETRIQEEIKTAKIDANNLISNAREKGSIEALSIKEEANKKISDINKHQTAKVLEIDTKLLDVLKEQEEKLEKSVTKKLESIINRTFAEAIAK